MIADLKGSEKPDEVVIVSGHLDSWDLGRGAIDDGAGVAVAMQVANTLKQLKLRPKRTIRVIAWMNEENGGAGSKAYAAEQDANMPKHFAAIESDLERRHIHSDLSLRANPTRCRSWPRSPMSLLSQGAFMSQVQANVGSDVNPMTQKSVPSFAPWFDQRTYFNYHHTAADTFDKIDPKEIAEVASVMAVLGYGLANLSSRCRDERAGPTGLSRMGVY